MQRAKQTRVNGRFRRQKLARITALETHAGFDSCLRDGRLHRAQILPRKTKRFFDDEMLARPRGLDDLGDVLIGIAANRDDVDVRIGEQRIEVVIDGNFAAVLRAEVAGVERAGRANGRDLGDGEALTAGMCALATQP
jgi:hypothetical protein